METGLLYLVATPIGNLEDITLRALRILSEVDYVLCEDTRVTGKLLHHHSIKAKMHRYDAHTSDSAHAQIISDLEEGKKIALVSDAGTPGISDPGVLLIKQARLAGVKVEVIPGPSAVTAAVSLSGIAGNQFTFLGFVPHKKGRETFFKSLADVPSPVIFFESTHRILKTLITLAEKEMAGEYSTVNRTIQVTVARELTKLYEELTQGSAAEVLQYFVEHPDKIRGEFVVMVETR